MVKINELAKELQKEMKLYADGVQEKMQKSMETISEQLKRDVENDSPERRPKYKNGWKIKKTKTSFILHNKHYQLTHLLEKGHVLRNGKRLAGNPHIAPNEQKAVKAYLKEVERAIKS